MHYFVFSEKDATLYQATGSQNTGMDEILEVRKDISPTGNTINVSRILIEFDLTRITRDINRGIIKKPKYFLNLSKNINNYFNLFLNSQVEKIISNIIYIYAFNVWIEDNSSMDKTMASIGNAFDNLNKVKSFIKKR